MSQYTVFRLTKSCILTKLARETVAFNGLAVFNDGCPFHLLVSVSAEGREPGWRGLEVAELAKSLGL